MSNIFDGSTFGVTGGCGFIGSHLVKELLRRGASEIFVFDSLRYGKRENLGNADPRITIVPFTIGSDPTEQLTEYLERTDFLFHLAAEKHNQSKESPRRVFEANIIGMYELLALAARCSVKRTIFSSSLYAYGDMTNSAMTEHDLPAPWTVYGISKLAGEHVLTHIETTFGMPTLALRYFFVYGPRQFAGLGYKSVIIKNFERMARGEAPVIFGDGQQALDYTFVDDIVDATLAAMQSNVNGMALNIGSGQAITVSELTDAMITVSGQELRPTYGPADWTAGTIRAADTSKARDLLDWKPKISLNDGLKRTYDWILQENGNEL